MAKTKAKLRQQGAARQEAYRQRERRKVLFEDVNAEIQKQLAEDLKFSITVNDAGNFVVHWDMDESSDEFIRAYAKLHGLTFDDVMRELSKAILDKARRAEAVKIRRN